MGVQIQLQNKLKEKNKYSNKEAKAIKLIQQY